MKKLFFSLALFLPSFSFTNFDREYVVTLKILDHGDGRYFVTAICPTEFTDFNLALYKNLGKKKMAFYRIGKNATTFVLDEACEEMVLSR